MSEQDHETPETNDEHQANTARSEQHTGDASTGDTSTGDGAAEHEQRQGEQANEATGQTGEEQANAAEASAVEASSTEEKPAEEKPEEAEAPEDLFDLMGEEGKKHKKKKTEPPRQGQNASHQQKREEKKYPAQAEIVYAGHRVTVPREMSGTEIIDELLADDFPELTKDSTEFTHDEGRNRIVPTRKALKKGSTHNNGGVCARRPSPTIGADDEPSSLSVYTQPRKSPLPPVHRVLAHDGVYEVRDTSLGTFTARVPGEVMMYESASLKVPKPPVELLETAVKIFKDRPDREALLTIMYDHRDGRHHLAWPEQSATAASIDYDSITETEDLIVYAEIHSHNSMDPFFSATDDTSEARSTGLYGVIGRVDLERPHAAFRYSCGHHFRRVSGASLFEDPARVHELLAEVPA